MIWVPEGMNMRILNDIIIVPGDDQIQECSRLYVWVQKYIDGSHNLSRESWEEPFWIPFVGFINMDVKIAKDNKLARYDTDFIQKLFNFS